MEDRWCWLIELDCDGIEGVGKVVRDGAWPSLLGELRLRGLRPLVAVVAPGLAAIAHRPTLPTHAPPPALPLAMTVVFRGGLAMPRLTQ